MTEPCDSNGRPLPRHLRQAPAPAVPATVVRQVAGFTVDVTRAIASLGLAIGFLALVLAVVALVLI